MDQPNHILRAFDEVLGHLRSDVSHICRLAVQNLSGAARGIREHMVEFCLRAIVDDEEVNALEKAIDARGVEILTRFHPVAGDLRFVISAMRVASNLERASDEAKSIARRGRGLLEAGFFWEEEKMGALFGMAQVELADAIQSFLSADLEAAHGLRAKDKALDAYHKELIALLSREMAERPEDTSHFLALLLIVRGLERIGDHAKNIAEEAIFLNQAQDVRYPNCHLPQSDGREPMPPKAQAGPDSE